MRTVVDRAPLLAALARLIGVVERKHTIPILGNVVATAGPGSLRLRATDLDMEIVEDIEAGTDEPGEITLPADKLHDIARNADGGSRITISTSGKEARAQVVSGQSRYSVPCLPADAFPKFLVDGLRSPWKLPAKTLADMLSRVAFSRCDLPSADISGTLIKVVGDELHVVACSTSGIALRREPAPAGAEIEAILLPKFTAQLVRWLADAPGDAEVSCSDSLVRVACGEAMITSKLLDGQYPDHLRIILEDHETMARTDQDALALAIKRARIMGDESAKSVRLSFAGEGLGVVMRGGHGEGSDDIAAEYDGPDAQFLMGADRLQEAIASLKGDVIELAFAPAWNPQVHKSGQVVIRAPSDPQMVINLMQPRA